MRKCTKVVMQEDGNEKNLETQKYMEDSSYVLERINNIEREHLHIKKK